MMPDLDTFPLFVFDINTLNCHVHSLRIIFSKYFGDCKNTGQGVAPRGRGRLSGCECVSYNRPSLEVQPSGDELS
jgi:hypothetical protein